MFSGNGSSLVLENEVPVRGSFCVFNPFLSKEMIFCLAYRWPSFNVNEWFPQSHTFDHHHLGMKSGWMDELFLGSAAEIFWAFVHYCDNAYTTHLWLLNMQDAICWGSVYIHVHVRVICWQIAVWDHTPDITYYRSCPRLHPQTSCFFCDKTTYLWETVHIYMYTFIIFCFIY